VDVPPRPLDVTDDRSIGDDILPRADGRVDVPVLVRDTA
jgi:hypothetical protein